MQIIEDVEENVLRSRFPRKELYIVNDQNVDQLIEMDKIVPVVFLDRINVLLGKNLGRNIQHGFLRIFVFDLDPDCVGQMRLSQTNAAENKQRVKRRSTGFVCDGHAGRTRQSVGIAFEEIVKTVIWV